eukprot:scaffold155616_cov19-Tisochrysis_lutea.AAC.2
MVLCDLGRQATSRQSLPMTANLAAEGSSFMATPNALDAASVQNRCCKDSIEMTASTSAQCANAVWRVSKDVLEAAHVAALCTTRLQVYQALVGLGVALHEICQTHVKVAIQPSCSQEAAEALHASFLNSKLPALCTWMAGPA